MPLTDGQIILRLLLASRIGAVLGIERELRRKSAGFRTNILIAAGSCIFALISLMLGSGDPTRVPGQIVTGIGFLGAGVIIRNETGKRVHGLTTAACVWLTACVGAACGIGAWRLIAVAAPAVFILLVLGGPFERFIHRHWPESTEPDTD